MTSKPHVKLTGTDGNAFSIMGTCFKAAKKSGWTPEQIEKVKLDMTSGDYDHLLQVVQREFRVS